MGFDLIGQGFPEHKLSWEEKKIKEQYITAGWIPCDLSKESRIDVEYQIRKVEKVAFEAGAAKKPNKRKCEDGLISAGWHPPQPGHPQSSRPQPGPGPSHSNNVQLAHGNKLESDTVNMFHELRGTDLGYVQTKMKEQYIADGWIPPDLSNCGDFVILNEVGKVEAKVFGTKKAEERKKIEHRLVTQGLWTAPSQVGNPQSIRTKGKQKLAVSNGYGDDGAHKMHGTKKFKSRCKRFFCS